MAGVERPVGAGSSMAAATATTAEQGWARAEAATALTARAARPRASTWRGAVRPGRRVTWRTPPA
ncbi:hypothetical protein ACP4OV_002703 [Aristida adscensionis]